MVVHSARAMTGAQFRDPVTNIGGYSMSNRIDALVLLKKLKKHLQNNHGVKEDTFYQALITLDMAIEELESRRAEDATYRKKILNLLAIFVKTLPSIASVVDLINKHWK